MAVSIVNEQDAFNSLFSTMKMSLAKVVTDINFEESVKTYIEKGGYDFKKSLKENVKDCIQYIAIRKAKLNL